MQTIRTAYNHKAIMQNAWFWFRNEQRLAAAGGGRQPSFQYHLKRAWNAAKQEARHYARGGTSSDAGLVILINAPIALPIAA